MVRASRKHVKNQTETKTLWQKVGMFFYMHRGVTIALWALLVLYGGLAYTTLMRREGFPSVNVPFGIVRVVTFKESPQLVDTSYTAPIMSAATALSSVKSADATSTNQGATISIQFKDGTDVQKELDSLKAKVILPADAQTFYIKYEGGKLTSDGDDLLVSVHGNLAPAELDAKATELANVLDSKVTLAERVRPIKLVEQIADPATDQTQSAYVRFDRFYDKAEGSTLPSAIVAIRGVANVDQLKLYDEVKSALDTQEVKNIGADVAISADFAEGIRDQVSSLQRNLIEGLIVVLVVSFILISWRASVITALAMATTVITTVGVLHLIGYTLNTITLFSLVLCLALIVDDTTIMIEAIDAALRRGLTLKEAAMTSLKKVALASSTGTLTTILAFAPMLFIGGILGKFVRAIPVTIIISLAVSLLVSILFIPLMMRLLVGKATEHKERKIDIANHIEESLGSFLSRTILWSAQTLKRTVGMRALAVVVSLVFVMGGALIFTKVEFNIFPSPKDGTVLVMQAAVRDRETASIERTAELSDTVFKTVRTVLGDDLERITLTGQGGSGSRDGFSANITLSPLSARSRSSVDLAKEIDTALVSAVPEMRIQTNASGVGPPSGSFEVRIASDKGDARKLANDIKDFMSTTELTRVSGTKAHFTDVTTTPSTQIVRSGTKSVIAVTAGFDAKDTSTLVTLGQKAVEDKFNAQLQQYGLTKDDLSYDFGQEADNQDSFSSMGRAAGPLFLAMLVLMIVLFRSAFQPLLIFTALPFAFFGVAGGLYSTKNPISFFAMLGVFALIGISLNNTILLTDYANQSRRSGKSPAEAIAEAVRERLRPLLTTSITSVLALLPLALNDPFWQGLAYTLIFGLISSTILVLVVFPYFYLIEEAVSRSVGHVVRGFRQRVL